MGPNPKKVFVVKTVNDPRPAEAADGDVVVSRTQFKKWQARQARAMTTQIVVCRFCWQGGTGPHKATAHAGTMKKDKQTQLYEHDSFCAGKQEAALNGK